MPDPEFTDAEASDGSQQGFGGIAKHCSAAQAHCIKKARDSRAFEPLGLNWDQYAERHFGISCAQANKLIRHLDRFGENYFHISEFARIGPATYRRLVNRVIDGRLHFDAKQLAVAPENLPRICAVIETIRAEWRAAQPARPARPDLEPCAALVVPVSEPAPDPDFEEPGPSPDETAAPGRPAQDPAPDPDPVSDPDLDSHPSLDYAAAVLNDWHEAASVSDEPRFFWHLTADAILLGVCPSERWTLSRFRIWAEPRFEDPAAWTYTPRDRSITFSPDRMVAWFDELLELPLHQPNYGSGVLVRQNGAWKIAQYHFATPILDPYLPENVQFGTSSRVK